MRKKIRGLRLASWPGWALALGLAALTGWLPAAAPNWQERMNYQGQLTDAAGLTVPDGAYSMVFRIYSVETGGVAIWGPETHGSVNVSKGLFNVLLGNGSPSVPLAFTVAQLTQDKWLSIEVNANGEMAPRQPLLGGLFAKTAENVGGTFPNNTANNLVVLDGSGKIPAGLVQGSSVSIPLDLSGNGGAYNLRANNTNNATNSVGSLHQGYSGIQGSALYADGKGVIGQAYQFDNTLGVGVSGSAVAGTGVFAQSSSGAGVIGISVSGIGVSASTGSLSNYALAVNSARYGAFFKTDDNINGVALEAQGPGSVGFARLIDKVNNAQVYGQTSGASIYGVYGLNTNATGTGVFGKSSTGVRGESTDVAGRGVYGYASAGGATYGVQGQVLSASGYGVYGLNSGAGVGVFGSGNPGVRGDASAASGKGVWGQATGSSGQGVYGYASNTNGVGVYGQSVSSHGVEGSGFNGVKGSTGSVGGRGVYGTTAVSGSYGVYAENTHAYGTAMGAIHTGAGPGTNGIALSATTGGESGTAVLAQAFGAYGNAVKATLANNGGYGGNAVYAENADSAGSAGYFVNNNGSSGSPAIYAQHNGNTYAIQAVNYGTGQGLYAYTGASGQMAINAYSGSGTGVYSYGGPAFYGYGYSQTQPIADIHSYYYEQPAIHGKNWGWYGARGDATGIWGESSASYAPGVKGTGYVGVRGLGTYTGVSGTATTTATNAVGVYGEGYYRGVVGKAWGPSSSAYPVMGEGQYYGGYFSASRTSGSTYGVRAYADDSASGRGIWASGGYMGVYGYVGMTGTSYAYAGYFETPNAFNAYAVYAYNTNSSNTGAAVYAYNSAPSGQAGFFYNYAAQGANTGKAILADGKVAFPRVADRYTGTISLVSSWTVTNSWCEADSSVLVTATKNPGAYYWVNSVSDGSFVVQSSLAISSFSFSYLIIDTD